MHPTTLLPRSSSWRVWYSLWTLFHSVEDTTKCEVECTNGGYCNPDNGQCVCPSNCRGVSCEECASTFPYTTILVCFVALVFVGYSCSWIVDLIKRKCRFCLFLFVDSRFYKRIAVQDPFVENLESIGIAAASQNSTAGDKLSTSPETPVSRWYRNSM